MTKLLVFSVFFCYGSAHFSWPYINNGSLGIITLFSFGNHWRSISSNPCDLQVSLLYVISTCQQVAIPAYKDLQNVIFTIEYIRCYIGNHIVWGRHLFGAKVYSIDFEVTIHSLWQEFIEFMRPVFRVQTCFHAWTLNADAYKDNY